MVQLSAQRGIRFFFDQDGLDAFGGNAVFLTKLNKFKI